MVKVYKPPRRNKTKSSRAKTIKTTVTVDTLDHQGKGVARDDGRVVFIEGALPTERCEVSISADKGRHAQGTLIKVLEPSLHRTTPFCEYFGRCGGCQTQYAEQSFMLAAKQQAVSEQLHRVAGIETVNWLPPLNSPETGYRRKTRLAVDARNSDAIRLGFRGRKSNDIINVEHCDVLTKPLGELLKPLHNVLNRLSNPRAIGHITLLEGDNLTQVTFRITKTLSGSDKQLLSEIGTDSDVQVLLETGSDAFEVLSKADDTLYYLADESSRINVGPNDFVQVNDRINRAMISQARDWLTLNDQDVLLDLFCGAGNFSVPLAASVKQVIGIEGVANMVHKATSNALQNGIANATFECADINASDRLLEKWQGKINKVLLDPARDGAQGIMSQIVLPGVSHILYVSCNPATFARDASQLVDNKYQLKKMCLMDMFPNTAHTELMALFVRSN